MSAGEFNTDAKYETRGGGIHRIRVQPETLAAEFNSVVNAVPAGAVNRETSARARGSRKALGVTARKVSVQFTGALPAGYSGDPVEIPVMTPATFDGILPGQAGTYLSVPIAVISKTPEQVR